MLAAPGTTGLEVSLATTSSWLHTPRYILITGPFAGKCSWLVLQCKWFRARGTLRAWEGPLTVLRASCCTTCAKSDAIAFSVWSAAHLSACLGGAVSSGLHASLHKREAAPEDSSPETFGLEQEWGLWIPLRSCGKFAFLRFTRPWHWTKAIHSGRKCLAVNVRRGGRIWKFRGRWPHTRICGVNEPASVVFSIANMGAHLVRTAAIFAPT